MLSRDDILEAIIQGHLKIYPFENKNLTGIGYNLSTTYFAFSVNRGILLTIYQHTTQQGIKRYVMIPRNDTVLFFSKEYIEVDRTLAGTFHSKVSRVCQGLGHISTTLDPTWKGQLIISVHNALSKDIKFDLDMDNGNIMTLLLYRLNSEVTGDYIHDNNQGRCDLLLEHFAKPITNKKYKNKHIQLEQFVVGALASSLNGYDCFIKEEQPEDQYTQKVKQLKNLWERWENDKAHILENNYSIGTQGKYYYFRNIQEIELIQSCSLYQMKKQLDSSFKLKENEEKNDLAKVADIIDGYIKIINYEIEIINHIRRFNWQNEKIEQFAGESSEFVYLRHKNAKIARITYFGLLLLLIVIVGFGFYELCRLEIPDNMKSVIATISAPVIVLISEWWHDFLKKSILDRV